MDKLKSIIVKRLLKNYRIREINKAIGYTFSMWHDDKNQLLDLANKYKFHNRKHYDGTKEVYIERHAYERWNERVGPIIDYDTLQLIFEIIIKHHPYRLVTLGQGIGLLDDSIIFTYEERDKILFITTFYGRNTLQPSLNQITHLRRYNLNNNEYISLNHSIDVLNTQALPPIPKQYISFHGRTTMYILECYLIANQNNPFYICYQKEMFQGGKLEITGIDIDNPKQQLLPNNVLYILHRIGLTDFVFDHLYFHKPERVMKTHERMVTKMIESQNTFAN